MAKREVVHQVIVHTDRIWARQTTACNPMVGISGNYGPRCSAYASDVTCPRCIAAADTPAEGAR